jgi:structural maintenance of chromosomes protein 5
MQQFKDGSIKTLRLQNFQTYRDARFSFCPTLNFIAGPNGSGKSTIANAIALVFGGTPRTMGKSRDLGEYVRFGEAQGEIEATILLDRRDVVLRRTIRRSNHSTYHIDGKPCKKGEYEGLLGRIGVHVDNLCQFLPQERVSEFSGLSPEDLLVETLSAVGEEETVAGIEELEKLEKEACRIDEKVEHFLGQKESMEAVLENISIGVRKIEEKERRLALLLDKKEWRMYALLRSEYTSIKAKMRSFEKEITRQVSAMEETDGAIAQLKSGLPVQKLDKKCRELEEHNAALAALAAKINKASHTFKLLDVDARSLDARRSNRMAAAEKLDMEIESLEEEHSKLRVPREPAPFDEGEMRRIEEKVHDLTRAKSAIQYECFEIKKRMEELQSRKKSFGEADRRKMEQLRRFHLDTYRAVLWLRGNTHRFRDEIIEPPILHIGIKNASYALEVESFLNFQCLTPFICKSPEDFEAFMRIMKDEQKLGINAVEAITGGDRRSDLEQARRVVKKYGFDAVLIDLIDARREILDYLAAIGAFDGIPVTKKSVDEAVIFRSTDVKRMAANGRYLEVKRSRYGDDYVIIDNPLKPRDLFSWSFSQDEIESIERELSAQDQARRKNGEELRKILEQLEDLDLSLKEQCRRRNEHNTRAAEVRRARSKIQVLESSLERKRREKTKLLDLEDLQREGERLEEKKEDAKAAWGAALKSMEDFLSNQEYFASLREANDLSREIRNVAKNIELLEERRAAAECRHSDAIKSLSLQKSMLAKVKERAEEKKRMLGKIKTSDEYSQALAQLPEDIDELESEIIKEQAKLSLISIDDRARAAYRAQEENLNAVKGILEENLNAKGAIDRDIAQRRERLLSRIKVVVGPVNESFGGLFRRFNCEGRVAFVGEDAMASRWRLNILVRFRAGEGLEVLSSYRQSGGEKSVSTVLFLLAIQSLRPLPFRLVDEINQGMDRHNEKLVHDILVDMSREEGAAQFFIITPKIVPNLTYSKTMKIVILYTGDGALSPEAFVKYKLRSLRPGD